MFANIVKQYEKSLRFALKHRKLTIGGTMGILYTCIFVYGKFNNGIGIFPQVEHSRLIFMLTCLSGQILEKSNEVTKIVENKLSSKTLNIIFTNVGSEIGQGVWK